jgi:GWxTD domain-containing protein
MQVRHMKKYAPILILLAAGLASCSSGPKVKLDPDSEKFYETARLIMAKEEKDIFSHLPDAESRQEFIKDFWDKRDPDPYSEENEFKKEFFDRIEYANKRFKEGTPGWKTDRGRIYIYMGPPDKFEEFFTHDDPEVRGPILWWIYYNYELGIEFVDEKNNGTYRIRSYTGDFFSSLDNIKLGQVPVQRGEKRKFVNFKLDYNQETKEIVIALPVEPFDFKDKGGKLQSDLEFQFFVYAKSQAKIGEFKKEKSFAGTVEEVEKMKEIVFTFPYDLNPGVYYLDVVIVATDASLGKTRKIFEVKV